MIRVADSGEGIAPEFLPRVFERFSQGDTGSKREKPGLGLGLAISKYVVDLHGGTIEAEIAGRGRGATFTVTLPLVASANENEVAVPHAASVAGATEIAPPRRHDGAGGRRRSRFAETRVHCALAGRRDGPRATSVGAAMSHLEQSAPDVIVSDVAIPLSPVLGTKGITLDDRVAHHVARLALADVVDG